MTNLSAMFTKDILLDDDKFSNASERFSTLASDIENLRKDISSLLEELEKGFDTPAGKKFVNSCKNGLLQPMDDQAAVVKHVSDNLTMARSKYESVFTEYMQLNNSIK